ncbi:MAG: matrixin family metalloprotease [Planctomycetota bacterium]
MKPLRYLLPAAIVAGAAILTLPRYADAFVVINGINRDANEIGFQVNQASFTDAASNANVTPHTNFPGATGAAMALWKAAAEWNSELRGNDGNGDPLQNGGLGSGGSNFDFMYQGVVTSNGATNNNVIACTASDLGGGVFAVTFFQLGGSGWNMLFDNGSWNWVDGPGNETGGASTDIQGIGTHELGHALGLGHSADGTATMFSSTTPGGSVGSRTIATDDSNGVKNIYGTKVGTKPKITNVTGNIYNFGIITITGTNFAVSNNEIWFTKDFGGVPQSGGGPPQPIKVTGIGSTGGGTSISVQVPLGVLAGDVIVRTPGANGDQTIKSAPFPFRLQPPPAFPVLANLSPASLPIATSPLPVLTINGTGFSNATSVQIGTRVYTSTQFQIINSTQIQVDFNPPPLEIGNVNVTVTNPSGTSPALPVTLTLPTGNILLLDKNVGTAGGNLTIYGCGPAPGEFPAFGYSGCLTALDLSPYFIFNIGGCGDLGFLEGTPLMNAAGVAEVTVQIPADFHGLAFLQFVRLNISNLTFPAPVSNISTLLVP